MSVFIIFLIVVTKYLTISNLEEKSLLAHSLGTVSSWQGGSMSEVSGHGGAFIVRKLREMNECSVQLDVCLFPFLFSLGAQSRGCGYHTQGCSPSVKPLKNSFKYTLSSVS